MTGYIKFLAAINVTKLNVNELRKSLMSISYICYLYNQLEGLLLITELLIFIIKLYTVPINIEFVLCFV